MRERNPVQSVAMLVSIVFILVAILGFIPGITTNFDDITFAGNDSGAELLGIFQVSILHNIVHLLFGALGIAAARGIVMSARGYAQFIAVSYGLLTVLGLLPATHTTFGLIPIYGNDVWLHGGIALVSAIVGFASARPASAKNWR